MNSILSQLFRGEYVGGAHPYNPESELEIAFEKTNEQEAAFKQKLPAELISDFEKYIASCEHSNFLASEQDFIAGFQLAMQLFAEGMNNIKNIDKYRKPVP